MYICPNCKKTSETPLNFCYACGSAMVEQQPVEAQPVEAQPVAPQPVVVQPVETQPVAPQPQYQQPQYQQPQYQQPQYPQTPAPSKAKMIVGMILSISGTAMSALGLIFVLAFMSFDNYMGWIFAFAYGLIFSLIGLPCSIIGLILSKKCINAGVSNGMTSVGKALGIVGLIISAVVMFLAFICLGVSTDYSPSYYDYDDFF